MRIAALEAWKPAADARTHGDARAGAVAVARTVVREVAGRVPALDGLRGIASLQVFLAHCVLQGLLPTAPAALHFVHRISGQLCNGVDLFFVLSGFLISRILLGAKSSTRYFQTFYARRFFRIVPLYLAILIGFCVARGTVLTSLAPRLFDTSLPLWPYWLFSQNFLMASRDTFGAIWLAGTWSLAVEEQFYLLLPPIIKRCSIELIVLFAGACLLIAPAVRLLVWKTAVLPPQAGYVLLISRCDALAAGILVSVLVTRRPEWLARMRSWLPAVLVLLGALALVIAYRPTDFFVKFTFVERSLASVFYAGLLAYVLGAPEAPLARLLSTRPARAFGDMAYANYLLHPIVLGLTIPLLTGHEPGVGQWADLLPAAVAGAIAIGLSAASWRWFEQPILRLGRAFTY